MQEKGILNMIKKNNTPNPKWYLVLVFATFYITMN